MKKIAILVAAAFVFSASVAQAQPIISYNFADASYEWTHTGLSGDGDANGMAVNFSHDLMDSVVFEGGYGYQSYKTTRYSPGRVSSRVSKFTYGVAAYHAICENFHVLGRAGLSNSVYNYGSANPDKDEFGQYVGAGVRYVLDNDIELDGNVTYDHVRVLDTKWVAEGVAIVPVADDVAITGNLGLTGEGGVQIGGGARYMF